MKETAYNLFLYVEMPFIKALGVALHDLDGTDQEKLAALQRLVEDDHKTAKRYALKEPLKWTDYQSLMRLGRELSVFEHIFRDCDAPTDPLVVITPISDGAPHILATTGLGPLNLQDLQGTPLEEPGVMLDYLSEYVTDGQFDLPRLMNDDYFLAINLLYNAGKFVSCTKLLMSFIDTIAFIDTGDVPDAFVLWLSTYADLAPLGISPRELWEFRNGLVHMTNLRSRAVASGRTVPLIFYVGSPSQPLPPNPSGAKYLNLKALLDAIALAVSRWIETYNNNREKFVDFVSRYDLIVSDSRMSYVRM